ncbi:hypothetical protein BD779DRAFT_763728 [Infundibulicybe gibba]|nr:hypothetical protein BD779DRAFT_763728 [Infundibulicybe gibba]
MLGVFDLVILATSIVGGMGNGGRGGDGRTRLASRHQSQRTGCVAAWARRKRRDSSARPCRRYAGSGLDEMGVGGNEQLMRTGDHDFDFGFKRIIIFDILRSSGWGTPEERIDIPDHRKRRRLWICRFRVCWYLDTGVRARTMNVSLSSSSRPFLGIVRHHTILQPGSPYLASHTPPRLARGQHPQLLAQHPFVIFLHAGCSAGFGG